MSSIFRSRRSGIAGALAVVLVATLTGQLVQTAARAATLPTAADVPSVPGAAFVGAGPAADPTADAVMKAAPTVAWPTAGTVEVALPAAATARRGSSDVPLAEARAGSTPVWIGARAGGVRSARVTVLDRATTDRAGVDGLLVRVGRADGVARSDRVTVTVDYTAFRDAYGGDWASRLRLVRVPACRLTTPELPGCQTTPLPSSNDPAAGLVSGEVDLTPVGPAASMAAANAERAAAAAGTMVGLLAAPSSDGGTFGASAMQPSSAWSGGGQAGDFTWTYPMRVPPAQGGPEPSLGLSYSAQSLDGKTAATNNQPSWMGDGFDYTAGAVERAYRSCVDDGKTGVGDLCWATDNATLSLPGHGGELIQISTSPDVWRVRNDDGTKVERLTNTTNGDNNNEYWKVTTPDGTRYFFGLNKLPGSSSQQTKSVFTVPVFGNNSGEPCNNSSGFASSWCQQAYKWHLDYVVDPHGNTMSLWYSQQTNRYARNVTASAVSAYTRGGHIERISYGTRQDGAGNDDVFTAGAPAEVVFSTADRCVTPGATCVESNKPNWPDVPWDQQCNSTTSCPDVFAPTFFTQKRLASVTTRVRDGSGYRDVERWSLTHTFKNPGDGHPKLLWLDRLSHTGLAGGANTTTPDVTFGGVQLNNRVDKTPTKAPIIRFRVSSISNEVGGVTSVNYSPAECVTGSNMPASADNNSKRCYPVYWTPYGATAATFDWFHKYVVTSVTVRDNAANTPLEEYTYTYSSTGPMWHHDVSDVVPSSHRSWGQWRGYSKVRTVVGAADSARMQTDATYFQGMHGDKTASGTRSVSLPADPDVPGSVAVNDEDWLFGSPRTKTVYNGIGDGAPVVSRTVTDPWWHGPTAERTRNGLTTKAYMVGEKRVTGLLALDGGRGWRKTRTTNTYDTEDGSADPSGLITQVEDAGDLATTADDKCARTTYAKNPTAHILTAVSRVETVAVACSVTPDRPTDVLADTRTWYDGATSFNQTITKGDVTRTESLHDWVAGAPVYVQVSRATYDNVGRVVDAFDALDRKTTTTYVPASGGPVTGSTVTNHLGWTTTTEVDPANGEPTVSIDVNGRRTEAQYDGLGRLTAAWRPGRVKGTDTPHVKYTYVLRNSGGPSAVLTEALNKDGTGYRTSSTIYDGRLRERQTQVPAPNGGRIITDAIHDSRGLTVQQNHGYYNAGAPDSGLFVPSGPVPSRTLATHDNAGRTTAVVFQTLGAERWRTTTYHGGDHVDVTALAGDTGTSTWSDARGQTTELRQYHGRAPSGAYDATRYTYTPSGAVDSVTDPAGNVWRFRYDIRGNKIEDIDPDRGSSTHTYDVMGQRLTTTDARGVTLVTDYDDLGRRTRLSRRTGAGDTLLAQWTYDTLAKGQPTRSTRYVDGHAYTSAVTGYDEQYRSLGTTVTIPDAEGALAGTYTTTSTFNADGSTATTTLPAVGGAGGLPTETIQYGYTATGLPTTLSGLNTYITGAFYDSLGRVGTMTLSNGTGKALTQVWNFEEGTGRLQEHGVLDDAAGLVYQDVWYTYDDIGNVTSIKDKTGQYGAGPDDNQCFRFDHRRRLTEAWTPGNGDCAANPTVAGLGGPAPYWQSFGYDVTGNRTSDIDRTKTTTVSRSHAFPASGPDVAKPHAVTGVTHTNGASTTSDSFGYDAAGNMTTRNRAGKPGQTLVWDAEGHLASVTDSTGTVSYIYDANGNRLIAKEPTGNTLYLGGQEVRSTTSGLSATRYYGSNAVRTTAGGLAWTVSDHHGTNTLVLKAADLAVTQRRATPFGGPRGVDPTWPTTKGFVGGNNDRTALTHLGAREYDPALGRFISVDPIFDGADPQAWNGYAYAHNNPVTGSDPSGLADQLVYAGSTFGAFTNNGYRYFYRKDYYNVCASFNANLCYGTYDSAGNWHWLYYVEVRILAVQRVAIVFGPVVPPKRQQPAYKPPAKCATRPDPPAGIRADPGCGLFDIGCLNRSPGRWWKSNKGVVLTGAAVVAGAACVASAGAACAALSIVGAAASAADRVYSFSQSKDRSWQAWTALGAGLALDAVAARAGMRAGCVNSFVPGTRVALGKGGSKAIEKLTVGDTVLATDPKTGVTAPKKVEATIVGNGTKVLVDIAVRTGNGTSTVTATHNHPFWVAGPDRWTDAIQLKPGQLLRTAAGNYVQVSAVTVRIQQQQVHNLTVAEVHTYYVLAGDTSVLVHNCGTGNISDKVMNKHILPRHDPSHPDSWMWENKSKFEDWVQPDHIRNWARLAMRKPMERTNLGTGSGHAHVLNINSRHPIGYDEYGNDLHRVRVWVESGEVSSVYPF